MCILTKNFFFECNCCVKMVLYCIICFIKRYLSTLRECPSGTFGRKCKIKCRYPSFGKGCRHRCDCGEGLCNHIEGCPPLGNPYDTYYSFSTLKMRKIVKKIPMKRKTKNIMCLNPIFKWLHTRMEQNTTLSTNLLVWGTKPRRPP